MRERDPLGAWLRSFALPAPRRAWGGVRIVRQGIATVWADFRSRPFVLLPLRSHRPRRQLPYEDNHVFGKRNSALTIRYPVNDHRAIFSVKQYRWPPDALENPNSSPLLEGVARMRGAYDNIEHMLAENREIPAKLEATGRQLTAVFRAELASEACKRQQPGSVQFQPRPAYSVSRTTNICSNNHRRSTNQADGGRDEPHDMTQRASWPQCF